MCYPARCSVMATPTFLFYCRQISFFYSLPYLLPHDGALTSAFDVSLYPLILLPLSMAAFYTLEVNSQPLFHHPLPTETSSTNIVPLLFPFSFLYMFTSSHFSKYRHIVSTLTSAISYASVSHMLLPVRHTLVTPPPHTHTHVLCVSIFNFTPQIARTLLDWNKFLHVLPRQNLYSLYNNAKNNTAEFK